MRLQLTGSSKSTWGHQVVSFVSWSEPVNNTRILSASKPFLPGNKTTKKTRSMRRNVSSIYYNTVSFGATKGEAGSRTDTINDLDIGKLATNSSNLSNFHANINPGLI